MSSESHLPYNMLPEVKNTRYNSSEEIQPLNPQVDLPSFMSFGLKPVGKTPLIQKVRRAT